MKKIPTYLAVVAVALIDEDGRVLMQRRRSGAQHGGLWEFPGGKVELAETLVSALLREIEEELALTLAADDVQWLARAVDADGGVVIDLYTCRRWPGVPQCLDAEAIAWFAPDRLADLAMPPLDIPLARAVRELLQS